MAKTKRNRAHDALILHHIATQPGSRVQAKG
jgi:hypothetical protein